MILNHTIPLLSSNTKMENSYLVIFHQSINQSISQPINLLVLTGLAIDYYQNAIQISPDHYRAYCNIGLIKQEQQRYPEALIQYKHYIRIRPKDPQAYNL